MVDLIFAKTARQFTDRLKFTTRRSATPARVAQWIKAWETRPDFDHGALDRFRLNGGLKIGTFKLTAQPYIERLGEMPEDHLALEGGTCKTLPEFFARYFPGESLLDNVLVIPFAPTPAKLKPGVIARLPTTIGMIATDTVVVLNISTIEDWKRNWPNPEKRSNFEPMATCFPLVGRSGDRRYVEQLCSFPPNRLIPMVEQYTADGFDPHQAIATYEEKRESEGNRQHPQLSLF
jgi:hypothetical protein